jgi:hypothetical protein
MNQHGCLRERARAVYGIERLQNFKRQLQNDYLLDGPRIFDAGGGRLEKIRVATAWRARQLGGSSLRENHLATATALFRIAPNFGASKKPEFVVVDHSSGPACWDPAILIRSG